MNQKHGEFLKKQRNKTQIEEKRNRESKGETAILVGFEPDLKCFSCDQSSSKLFGKLDELFYELNRLKIAFLNRNGIWFRERKLERE